jgi:hypothetical protein
MQRKMDQQRKTGLHHELHEFKKRRKDAVCWRMASETGTALNSGALRSALAFDCDRLYNSGE